MRGTTRIIEPRACSAAARGEFAELVRTGFDGSDAGLPARIEDAARLAFHRSRDGALTAIAALKRPGERYRRSVFEMAAVAAAAGDYRLELGWVFVLPTHRGRGLGMRLCRQLLESQGAAGVFATTRPDNQAMIEILRALEFSRAGKPYPHLRRQEELAVFLRQRRNREPGNGPDDPPEKLGPSGAGSA